MSLKGHQTWRWAKLTLILWLNLPLCMERNVSLLPGARLVILPAMSEALWQGHSFGMRCVLSSGLFPEVVLVLPSSSFLYKLLRKLTLEQDFHVLFHASAQFQWWEESFLLSLADPKALLFELWYGVELFCVKQGTWYMFLTLSANLLISQFTTIAKLSCF